MTQKEIYENCRVWLQFAETKNGFALAFLGAALAAETSLLSSTADRFKPFVLLSMTLISIAALCSLLSFLPRDKVKIIPSASSEALDGIIYFGHIARQDSPTYVSKAASLLNIPPSDVVSLDLLQQCHNLSIITILKLRLFYASVLIAGIAIVIPMLGGAARWLC